MRIAGYRCFRSLGQAGVAGKSGRGGVDDAEIERLAGAVCVARRLQHVLHRQVVRRRVDQPRARHHRRRLRQPRGVPERAHLPPGLISGARAAVKSLVGGRVQEQRLQHFHLSRCCRRLLPRRARSEPAFPSAGGISRPAPPFHPPAPLLPVIGGNCELEGPEANANCANRANTRSELGTGDTSAGPSPLDFALPPFRAFAFSPACCPAFPTSQEGEISRSRSPLQSPSFGPRPDRPPARRRSASSSARRRFAQVVTCT